MVEEAKAEAVVLEAVGGTMFVLLFVLLFVQLLNPNRGPVLRCPVEADGRSRIDLAPAGAPAGPAPTARSLLSAGKGRVVVTRGAGKRDIGRGRPLVLPEGAAFSSMAAARDLLGALVITRDGDSGEEWECIALRKLCKAFSTRCRTL